MKKRAAVAALHTLAMFSSLVVLQVFPPFLPDAMTATWPTSTMIATTQDWFGNPAVVLEQETRGFAAPPRGGCAISPDDVWWAEIVAPRRGGR